MYNATVPELALPQLHMRTAIGEHRMEESAMNESRLCLCKFLG